MMRPTLLDQAHRDAAQPDNTEGSTSHGVQGVSRKGTTAPLAGYPTYSSTHTHTYGQPTCREPDS